MRAEGRDSPVSRKRPRSPEPPTTPRRRRGSGSPKAKRRLFAAGSAVASAETKEERASLVARISSTTAGDRDSRLGEAKDKRIRKIKEERASLPTAKGKAHDVKLANATPVYSPDPPTRFALVNAHPQLPSSSVISSKAAAATPVEQDQRHSNSSTAPAATPAVRDQRCGEVEAKRKQQMKGGRTSLSAKRKDPNVKQANTLPSKRLKSPVLTMSPLVPARSTGVQMLLSASVRSPTVIVSSQGTASSKSQSPISLFLKKRTNQGHGSSHRSKRRKLTSHIWQHFEAIYGNDILVEAQCIHCNQVFKATRGVGTSACGRHIKFCEGKARLEEMVSQLSSTSVALTVASLKNWKCDQQVARQELVKLIVIYELPFSLVEYPKFRTFVAALNPGFKQISRTTIRSECIDSYEEGKAVLWDVLQNSVSRVSLTAELWTSNKTLSYLCVTCHYIGESWTLFKRIIKFTQVETPHDGWNLFNAMLQTLQDWNLENKVYAITLDCTSVNNNFVTALKENLVSKGQLLRKGKLFHCPCASYVFNLIVHEGYKAIYSGTKNNRDSFDAALEALRRNDPQYTKDHPDDWKMAKKIFNLLEPFYNATKVLSGSNYPTSDRYFHQIWKAKIKLEEQASNPDLIIRTMVHEMKEKLKKHWDLSYLTICIPVILDPHFKLKFLKFRLNKGFGIELFKYYSEVEKTFRKLFDEYSSEVGDNNVEVEHSASNVELNELYPWADWDRQQSAQRQKKVDELDRYLEEETMSVAVDLDILQYWKMHSARYPVIARMARDILAVPVSTVASGSAFFTGERVMNDYRSRLKSETFEALVCLQDWLRSEDSMLDNIAGNILGSSRLHLASSAERLNPREHDWKMLPKPKMSGILSGIFQLP